MSWTQIVTSFCVLFRWKVLRNLLQHNKEPLFNVSLPWSKVVIVHNHPLVVIPTKHTHAYSTHPNWAYNLWLTSVYWSVFLYWLCIHVAHVEVTDSALWNKHFTAVWPKWLLMWLRHSPLYRQWPFSASFIHRTAWGHTKSFLNLSKGILNTEQKAAENRSEPALGDDIKTK